MIAANSRHDESRLPLLTAMLAGITLLAMPVVFTLVFSTWGDSVARQVVAAAGLLTLLVFTFVRRKYESLLVALVFFSQFAVSLHTFMLQEPVKLQVFFIDILYVLFFWAALERRGSWWPDTVGWLFIAFIGWIAVAAYYSAHLHQSLLFLSWQVKYLFLYLFVRKVQIDEPLLRQILLAIAAILTLQCLLSMAQLMTGHWLGLEILGERSVDNLKDYVVKGSLRVCGTLGATNAFGGYIAALLVVLVPFVMTRFNIVHASGVTFGLIAVILCLSRAAWLSFLLGSTAVILAMLRAGLINLSRVVLVGIIGVMVLAAGIGVYYDKIVDRFQDRQAISSAQGRLTQIQDAWKVIEKHQITGIGPGVTQFFGRWRKDSRYVRNALPGVNMLNQVHNSQLQIWIETGALGFALFLTIIFGVFRSVIRASVPSAGEPRYVSLLRIGTSCAALSVMIDATFGTEFNNTQLFTLFWILLALGRVGKQHVATETEVVAKPNYIPVAAKMLS